MNGDCCAEPVAGPVVDARVLRHAWTALGPLRCGDWPAPYSLQPPHRKETLAVLDEVLAGVYLAVDADGRLRWLGKALRLPKSPSAQVMRHVGTRGGCRQVVGVVVCRGG